MSLLYALQLITLYGGIILFVAGTFGNVVNIYIFASVQSYRTTPTTFYVLVGTICNTIYTLLNLIPYIIKTVYGININTYSTPTCKTTYFLMSCLNITSMTFCYLSTIDQFLVTSKHIVLRRCSKIKWAHRIVAAVFTFWILHSTVAVVYYEVSPITKACGIYNYEGSIYLSVYILAFLCGGPIMLMIVFGFLTYRNISQTVALAEQQADRQLVKMVLMQVALNVVSMTPYGSLMAYGVVTANTPKSFERLMYEYCATIGAVMLSYLHYCGNFYVFFVSSSRFRRTVKEKLFSVLKFNRIQPSVTQTNKSHP